MTFLKAADPGELDATVILPRLGPLCEALSAAGTRWLAVEQPRALARLSRSQGAGSLSAAVVPLACQAPPYLARLAAAIRALRPDVVYTNGVKCHVIGALLRPVLRIPTVWHLRVHWGSELAGRLAKAGADLVIANSASTASTFCARAGLDGRLVVIPNAVDTAEFRPEGPVADTRPVPSHVPKVVLPGAFARLKGHLLLLRAAGRVRQQAPLTRFFFIGAGIYDTVGDSGLEAELRRAVADEGLEDRVVFTGFQHAMAPWYRAADIVVNASTVPEGFGRALLEAMACGRAVVGPRAGGVPEFVRHGRNGLLYEPGDAAGLADAIATLIADAPLRRRLGDAARQTALRFDSAEHAAKMLSVLRGAARRAPPGRVRAGSRQGACR